MKIFKTIDVAIQIFILLIAVFKNFANDVNVDWITYLLLIAAYQVLSSLTHFFIKIKKTWWRITYSILGIIVGILTILYNNNTIPFSKIIDIMIVLAPIMGVYYVVLSFVETVNIYNKIDTDTKIVDE